MAGRKPGSQNRFEGKPVQDAEVQMHLPVIQIDAENAEPVKKKGRNADERFRACVVAQSCSRVFGPEAKVRILRKHAYLSLPGDKFARRYILGKDAQRTVAAFDRNEPIEVGKMITFEPPKGAHTLTGMRKYSRKYRATVGQKTGVNVSGRKGVNVSTARSHDGLLRDGNYVKLA
jgi:hypothetical protein